MKRTAGQRALAMLMAAVMLMSLLPLCAVSEGMTAQQGENRQTQETLAVEAEAGIAPPGESDEARTDDAARQEGDSGEGSVPEAPAAPESGDESGEESVAQADDETAAEMPEDAEGAVETTDAPPETVQETTAPDAVDEPVAETEEEGKGDGEPGDALETPPDEQPDAENRMSVPDALAAYGHAYAATRDTAAVYADSTLTGEIVYTITQPGALLLATAYAPDTDAVKVWLMSAEGERLTGYVPVGALAQEAVTDEQADEMANVLWYDFADSEAGTLLIFAAEGEKPTPVAKTPDDEPAPETAQPGDDTTEYDSPETQEFAQVGAFLYVTRQTRAFSAVDETASDEYAGDFFAGWWIRDAVVRVENAATDALGRGWVEVSYVYDPEEDGQLIEEMTGTAWALASETSPTEQTRRTPTELDGGMAGIALLSAPSGFSLRTHSGGRASYSVGETNLYATSGHDSEYKQIARHPEYGTIYATPHYLKGETAYCLEHTMNSPAVRDHDAGPYTIVDLDGYRVTPGNSGYVFSDKTMHALAFVLRHTYPFMVLDRSDADNETWTRVAGQFAMREVICQLEGEFYVREYWKMDEFYRAYDQAPGVYLDYARWLAAEALDYVANLGSVTVTNQSVSVSGGLYVGTATLHTDAGTMRIPKTAGTVTGHTGGEDGAYYYLNAGDTVSVASTQNRFSVPIEIMPSSEDEARFMVGVTYADIQKLLLAIDGEPYPILAATLDFEIAEGAIVVTKTDAATGGVLAGAVFELLDASGVVVQTLTTGADGTAAFTGLAPGGYTVREKSAPEGYLVSVNNAQTVNVTAGATQQAAFSNDVIRGKIRIMKKDSVTGGALAGAQFTVTRLSGQQGAAGVNTVVATLTTGADGTAETGWLEYGQYRIVETSAPENYINSGCSMDVNVNENGKTYTFEVSNEPMAGYIQITKTDAERGTALSGVQFDIYAKENADGEPVATMTTNADGAAVSPPLIKGAYIVKEHANPEGYAGELVTMETAVVSNQTSYLTATNQPVRSKIRIVKKDALTGELLSGAEFTITKIAASSAANNAGVGEQFVLTTDEQGTAESDWLDYGVYELTETKAPEHFADAGFTCQVTISEDEKTYVIDVENEPTKGWIQIIKTDALDGSPVSGVQFDIYYNDAYGEGLAGTMTTDASGIAVSPPLRKGEYLVKEHANPEGYVAELVTIDAVVKPDETTQLRAGNQPIQGRIRIHKTDELTGESLAGAQFTVTRVSGIPTHGGKGDGEVVAVISTDEQGIAETPLLTYGVYELTETKAPEHFTDAGFTCQVTVSEDEKTYVIDVENEPTKGWLRLTKTDRVTGNPIEGVVFDVYYNDQYGEGLATTITTDESGIAMSEPLRKGKYIVKEHGATAGYVFETVTLDATIKSDETTDLTATNQPVMTRIRIYKRDADEYGGEIADTGTRGDGVLTGAVFEVRAAEDIRDRQGNVVHAKGSVVEASLVTRGDDASVTSGDLWPGIYEVAERTPPEGYAPNDEPVIVDTTGAAMQSTEAVIEYDAVKPNDILYGARAIVKLLGDEHTDPDPDRVEQPEQGAEFEVYLAKAGSYEAAREIERDYLVTDETGYAKTKKLPYGLYVLRQTAATEGYELKGPILFEIRGTEELINPPIITLTNMPIRYRLKFIKTDAETGKVVALAGTSFKLKNADGEYVSQTVHYPKEQIIDTFTTDETGTVTLPETVPWGVYHIEEVRSPEGYLIRTDDLQVVVGREGDTEEGVYELDIEVPNEPVKGRLLVEKKGLQLVGFEAVEDGRGNTIHQPKFELGYLAGAVFEVRAAEDIIGADGTLWYEKDALADTITTTASGGDASKELPLGKYTVVEVRTPVGYARDPKVYEVELTAADDQTAVVETEIEIVNEYLPAEVSLVKEKEILATQTSGEEIGQSLVNAPGEGFVFGLFLAEDIQYAGGAAQAGTLLATGETDEQGKLTFSGLFPHGVYEVKELYAPEVWVMDDLPRRVVLDPQSATEDDPVIRVSVDEPLLNALVYTEVTLTKTDITGEQTLPGAQIEVKNDKGEVIYRAYTDENGEIPDIPVTPGRYTFREIYAPEGYALNEAVLTFDVDEDGAVKGDTQIRDDLTRIQIEKQDEQGQPITGATFGLFAPDGQTVMTAQSQDGVVMFERIPYGTFEIREIAPAPGYLLADWRVSVSVNGAFVNTAKPLDVVKNRLNEAVIRKVDASGKALEGAVFGLFDEDGHVVMKAVSDRKGDVRFTKIPYGEYTIREIEAPLGYLASRAVVQLTVDDSYISSGKPIATFTNHPKRVRYKKVDTSGKPLPGVAFSLIDAQTGEVVETAVSDERGEFIFRQFDYGDWIIRETKAPEGYNKMDDIALHVGEDWKEPEPVTLVNIPSTYDFKKVDNRGKPISGVCFALEDEAGSELGEFYSGEDGIVHVTGLEAGNTYVIREKQPAEGYTKTDETIRLVIDENFRQPWRMKRIKNYTTIQTGAGIEVTPVMIAGGFALMAGVLLEIYTIRKRKKR